MPIGPSAKTVPLTEAQLTILSIIDRLGYEEAIDRLLAVPGHGSGSGSSDEIASSRGAEESGSSTIVGIVSRGQGSGS